MHCSAYVICLLKIISDKYYHEVFAVILSAILGLGGNDEDNEKTGSIINISSQFRVNCF